MDTELTPKALRELRIYPFTHHPKFGEELEEVFISVRDIVKRHQAMYASDWVNTGLVGLAVETLGKAGRVYGYLTLDKIGKDKFEDEVEDLVMGAVYMAVYLRMGMKE